MLLALAAFAFPAAAATLATLSLSWLKWWIYQAFRCSFYIGAFIFGIVFLDDPPIDSPFWRTFFRYPLPKGVAIITAGLLFEVFHSYSVVVLVLRLIAKFVPIRGLATLFAVVVARNFTVDMRSDMRNGIPFHARNYQAFFWGATAGVAVEETFR